MTETTVIKTKEQYDRIITSIDRGLNLDYSSIYASALDGLITLLRKAVREQYIDAEAMYEEEYGWDESPEPFEQWLDSEFPLLADLPTWIFSRIVEDA